MEQTLEAINLAEAVVGGQYRLRVPSRLDWVEAVVDHLTGRAVQCGALTQKRAGRVLLALHEALTNAIVHGNLQVSSELKERGDDSFARAVAERSADPHYRDRHVDVRSVYDGQAVRWVLSDQGKGFDVPKALRRLEEEDGSARPSGRGMVMIRAFVDDVYWEDGGRRAILSVRKGEVEEKRAHMRHPVQQTVRVAPIAPDGSVDWGPAHDGLARNVSQEGIALLQSRLQTSGRVLITIPVKGGSVSVPAVEVFGLTEVGVATQADLPECRERTSLSTWRSILSQNWGASWASSPTSSKPPPRERSHRRRRWHGRGSAGRA